MSFASRSYSFSSFSPSFFSLPFIYRKFLSFCTSSSVCHQASFLCYSSFFVYVCSFRCAFSLSRALLYCWCCINLFLLPFLLLFLLLLLELSVSRIDRTQSKCNNKNKATHKILNEAKGFLFGDQVTYLTVIKKNCVYFILYMFLHIIRNIFTMGQ